MGSVGSLMSSEGGGGSAEANTDGRPDDKPPDDPAPRLAARRAAMRRACAAASLTAFAAGACAYGRVLESEEPSPW